MRVRARRWWHTTHGMSDTPEYKCWNNMYSRCNNQNHPRYKDWGGRGIKMCEKWMSFEGFFEDMGRKPSGEHTIERIDNDLGYNKDNCVWATTKEQAGNRRSNREIEYLGKKLIVRDWASELDVSVSTINSRLQRGWSMDEIARGNHLTGRRKDAIERHGKGNHSRNCEVYISRNTYRCKYTDKVFKKGVGYGRPYK